MQALAKDVHVDWTRLQARSAEIELDIRRTRCIVRDPANATVVLPGGRTFTSPRIEVNYETMAVSYRHGRMVQARDAEAAAVRSSLPILAIAAAMAATTGLRAQIDAPTDPVSGVRPAGDGSYVLEAAWNDSVERDDYRAIRLAGGFRPARAGVAPRRARQQRRAADRS